MTTIIEHTNVRTDSPLKRFVSLLTMFLVGCGLSACGPNPKASGPPESTQERTQAQSREQSQPDIAKQQKDAEQRARPEIEERRQQAQQEAEKTLVKEAIAAITETQAAVKAIADNKPRDAMAAIERANGKITTLLARYPAAALIPVSAEVNVVDLAPLNLDDVRAITDVVDGAVRQRDYPTARLLLHGLTSEIRVRTINLPLGRYPDALREAARLLDQQKNEEASSVLLTALNTLTVVERADPLPLVLAQKAIAQAQQLRDTNKDMALTLLANSRLQLERAKELGYAGKDPEYVALNKSISDLERQLKGKGETQQAFSNLKERFEAFFKRQSESIRRSKQG